jgi:ubiquitin-like modifier-activating enzyme ATG7
MFQCTVTRPGLSFIASALAVELMVAVLQSPLGNKHPAETKDGFSGNTGEMLDVIPHQIRGSLLGFTQYQPMVGDFDSCQVKVNYSLVTSFRPTHSNFVLHVRLQSRQTTLLIQSDL